MEINLLYLPFCSLIIENLTYPRVIKNRLKIIVVFILRLGFSYGRLFTTFSLHNFFHTVFFKAY